MGILFFLSITGGGLHLILFWWGERWECANSQDREGRGWGEGGQSAHLHLTSSITLIMNMGRYCGIFLKCIQERGKGKRLMFLLDGHFPRLLFSITGLYNIERARIYARDGRISYLCMKMRFQT